MREWTAQQRRAIDARGKNIIVSAGAGSGKTAVMIERICSLLGEGHDIKRMLVCTFTKTAAADMKRKLGEALQSRGDKELVRQAAKLGGADISTLHAWCAHVLKSWFFDAGLDPEFTVLEEGEEAAYKLEAAESAIAEQKENGDADFSRLYAVFLSNRNHKKLRDALLQAYEYARSQPDPRGWLMRTAQKSDAEYRGMLYSELYAEKAEMRKRAEELLIEHEQAGFKLDIDAIRGLCGCMDADAACADAAPQLRKDKQFADLHERFKALKKSYARLCARRAAIADMPPHDGSLAYSRALASLALVMDEKYTELKKERVKADYGDLEHGALKVLCGAHGAEITGRYDFVFVDEYQDISPLQEEILSKFGCEMFFVGDIKQSIYGFRMCRPKFFMQKRKAYAAGEGLSLELTANFRSGGEILSAVNRVFSSVMTEGFGGTDYKAAPLTAGKTAAADVSSVLISCGDECAEERKPGIYSVRGDEGNSGDSALERETDRIADEIIDMLDTRMTVDGAERDVEFGDIAVLVRSRGRFTDMLEKKLRALSVPVTVVSSDSPADSFATVSALICMLRLLDNMRDDVSLAAVMLFQSFGNFSADELADIRKSGDGKFCDLVFESCDEKVVGFLRGVNGLRARAPAATVAELAGMITAQYGMFNHALAIGGEREAAALDAFCEHLATQDNDTLHGYLRHVAICGMPKLKVGDGGKAVRIMTVHASKGLEFPCVILPDLDKHFNRRDVYAAVICDEEEGIVMRSFDIAERSVRENPRYAVCSSRLCRALAEEELRILYVAMTRAQNRLTLFSLLPDGMSDDDGEPRADKAGSYIDWLYGFLKSVEKKRDGVAFASPREKARVEPDGNVVAELKRRFARNAAFTPQNVPVKASVSGVVRAVDGEESAPELFGGDDRAAERGSAYHKFMQRVRFGETGEYERLCEKYPSQAALIDDRESIERAFADVAEFIGNDKYVREKEFVFNALPQDVYLQGEGKILVQGVIDLMVIRGDGSADIVDYKTGSEKSLKSQAYIKQLELYKKAAESILGIKVRGTYLYGFSCGKFIRTDAVR